MEIYPEVKRNWPSAPLSFGCLGGHQLLGSCGFVRLPLGVITVSGTQRLKWLESLTTQKLERLVPGESTEALILDVSGHIDLAFYLVDDGEKAWLITEEPLATHEFLTAMKFRNKVEIADVSQEIAVIGIAVPPDTVKGMAKGDLGDSLGACLKKYARVQWNDPWPEPVGDTTVYTVPEVEHPASSPDALRRRLAILPGTAIPSFEAMAQEKEWKEVSLGAWEALRISLWRPRLGREGIPGVLPHELDWLRTTVALNKGCYTGQETVAKLVNRGRPPRRLVFLDLDGSSEELPAVGSELRLVETGEKVGVLTSVAYHPTDGQIALGLVKRQTNPEEILELSSPQGEPIRAAQTVIVNSNGENPKRFDPEKHAPGLGIRPRHGGSGRQLGGLGRLGRSSGFGSTNGVGRGIKIGMKGSGK